MTADNRGQGKLCKHRSRARAVWFSAILASSLPAFAQDGRESFGVQTELSIYFRNGTDGARHDPDWPIAKRAQERTGVRLEPVTFPESGDTARDHLQSLISSDTFPDILGGGGLREVFNSLGPQGALQPLDTLIAQHTPNIATYLEANKDALAGARAHDGKLYHIPVIDPAPTGPVWVIRQDWLSRLDLPPPNTVAELEAVLTAFRDGDPDGNGLRDDVPLAMTMPGRLDHLLVLWDGRGSGSGLAADFRMEQGRITHGYTTEAFRTGVRHLAQWAREGLIDLAPAADQPWGMSLIDPAALGAEGMPTGLQVLAPPASVTGYRVGPPRRSTLRDEGWGIGFRNPNPEATIRYFDFWFSPEGAALANFGIEGVQYDRISGEAVLRGVEKLSPADIETQMRTIGARISRGYPPDPAFDRAILPPAGRKAVDLYRAGGFWQRPLPPISLRPADQRFYDLKAPAIRNFMRERLTAWVSGESDVDDEWRAYQAELIALGLPDLLKILNTAYRQQGCSCAPSPETRISPPPEAAEDPTIANPPITLNIHFRDYSGRNTYDEDTPVERQAAIRTGIALRNVPLKRAEKPADAINMFLTSGDMPDIFGGNNIEDAIRYWGVQGAFLPLDSLIADHAPHLNHFLQSRPDLVAGARALDGQLYHVPNFPDGAYSLGYFIRQDWLDTLGLDVPQTVDELHDVLLAFRNDDPNGNGEQDEIPFFARLQSELLHLVTLWDARNSGSTEFFDFYIEDGVIRHGAAEDNYRRAIRNLALWYREGLIDPALINAPGSDRDTILQSNLGGMTHDWFGSTAAYNTIIGEEIPGFKLRPIAPPQSPSGRRIEERQRPQIFPHGWAISHTNPHPIETIRYFDYWFSPEGRRLANFGVDGVHYDLIDGAPVFRPEILNGPSSVVDLLLKDGAQIPRGFPQDFAYEAQWMNDIALEGIRLYEDGAFLADPLPHLALNESELRIYLRYWRPLREYMAERSMDWIAGIGDVDTEWDTYIEELNDRGLNLLLTALNAAYQRRECSCEGAE
ncbi:extracellular solute-binding protein [Palleronia caenipelagi]|uniref:Extracellular solute-binding protein n=1 Tax=Palleronia caenipelagi TaxID=2489174 RepID=A0A547PJQ3_9RHOB|nr:extracellular solute-binding protein [Palleronia caenipelagi]TRD14359.1 extracellular solute-binding protein [Palleronia caenipelagi]